jgi:hypothetical protein
MKIMPSPWSYLPVQWNPYELDQPCWLRCVIEFVQKGWRLWCGVMMLLLREIEEQTEVGIVFVVISLQGKSRRPTVTSPAMHYSWEAHFRNPSITSRWDICIVDLYQQSASYWLPASGWFSNSNKRYVIGLWRRNFVVTGQPFLA